MRNIIKLKILTPEKIVYQDEVLEIVIPTEAGEIAVFPTHAPLVTLAKTGEMIIKKEDHTMPFSISGGIVEIRPSDIAKDTESEVIILAYQAEVATEIDIVRAEEAYDRAVKAMEEAKDAVDVDFARFQSLVDKELNRVKIGKKWKK